MATSMPKGEFGRRLMDGLTMFIVSAASLFLLLYVSYGDSKRTYEQIHIEKITANGLVVQTSIENFLRDGLPLKQYAGFASLTAPMLESEDLDAMAVYDQRGRQVFLAVDKSNPKLPAPPALIKTIKRGIEIERGATHYQLIFPLKTRFETVGSLVVVSPNRVVNDRLIALFKPFIYWAIGLSAVFSLVITVVVPCFPKSRIPWRQIGYGLTFFILSTAVVSTMVVLYFDGVQNKSKAAAVTLSQRLNDIVAFKLQFKDIDGLDKTFSEYRRANSEIDEAALVEDGAIAVDTKPDRIGKPWVPNQTNFEYHVNISKRDELRRVELTVTVPRDVVFARVLRSVKNFAALFIATAFMAGLFLQVAASLEESKSGKNSVAAEQASVRDASLIFVKPTFFLAVFIDALTYSFLPKFMQQAAIEAGLSVSYASVPFTAYYLCFALSLLPAGNLADRYGSKPLILSGLLLAGASVAGMFLPLGIHELTVLRGLAGIGQGVVLIGVQTYILAVASPEKKTQGMAIIVFGFQGGMLSGMALGSLLVNQLQARGVFAIGGAVAVVTLLYTMILLPSSERKQQASGGLRSAVRKLLFDIRNVVTDLDFLKTMFCIGVPAKAILTGVITFAMPLLLGQYGYRSEDIGQIIMLYGLGVIVTSGYVSRLVDRTSNSEGVLFWGAVVSGVGLVMIGLMGSGIVGNGALSTIIVVAGSIMVGIAHGFINAPVVTHVAQIELAKRLGANPVTTSYRFLERSGHIAGPFLLAQLFLIFGQQAQIIAWIGFATTLLGLIFVAHNFWPRRARAMAPERVR